jgi:hypothetical protein
MPEFANQDPCVDEERPADPDGRRPVDPDFSLDDAGITDADLDGITTIIPPGGPPDPGGTACGTALVDSTGCTGDVPCPGLS